MIGTGTLINAACIMIGGLGGLTAGKALKTRYQEILTMAMGISVMFLGAAGTMEKILVVSDGKITTQGTYMMIFSLAAGALLGEWINIEDRMEQF